MKKENKKFQRKLFKGSSQRLGFIHLTFLVCVCLFSYEVSSQFVDTSPYWLTGSWGHCVSQGCGLGGIRLRTVNCYSYKLDRRVNESFCHALTKPSNQTSCFKICEEHRQNFQWSNSSWSECKPNRSFQSVSKNTLMQICGEKSKQIGIQNRLVRCVCLKNSTAVVDDVICAKFAPKLAETQSCQLPCPIDCVLSEFSFWQKCSVTCGNGTETRFRRVLREPRHGGLPCGDLIEFRLCSSHVLCSLGGMVTNERDRIRVGRWSSCQRQREKFFNSNKYHTSSNRSNHERRTYKQATRRPFSKLNEQLIGFRSRQIECDINRNLEEIQKSKPESLVIVETCAMSQKYQVTSWTNWSLCKSKCFQTGTQTRKRQIVQLSINSLASCPQVTEERKCRSSRAKNRSCQRYLWSKGEWSPCETAGPRKCGRGTQWRHVFCVAKSQKRKKTFSDINSPIKTALESYCDKIKKPKIRKECNVPCQSTCVMGSWSEWSQCAPLEWCSYDRNGLFGKLSSKQPKQQQGFARRIRSIQVETGTTDDCEHEIELIPCKNPSCYFWKATNVSECLPENQRSRCGTGHIDQFIECRNVWRQKLPNEECKNHKADLLRRLYPCYKPCSGGECVYSDWTSWSPCAIGCLHKKTPSVQSRTRTLIGSGLEPCKEHLKETRSCQHYRCSVYHWKTSLWSPCSSHPQLGLSNDKSKNQIGRQKRNVFCNKKRYGKVKNKNCLPEFKPISSRMCVVSKAQRCVLSKWTPWTTCPDLCTELKQFQDSYSKINISMTRKRKRYVIKQPTGSELPCNLALVEETFCETSKTSFCPQYKWIPGNWSKCLVAKEATSVSGLCKGIQKRLIRCKVSLANSTILEPANDYSKCLKRLGKYPEIIRPCNKRCDTSKKELLQDKCFLKYLNLKDEDNRFLNKTRLKQKLVVQSFGNWSSCILNKRNLNNSDCGEGNKYRALSCVDEETGLQLDSLSCNINSFEVELCNIPCPEDCKLSDWIVEEYCGNQENDAKQICGSNLKNRSRHIISHARNGGRKCPDVDDQNKIYQSISCFIECREYFWYASAWSTCQSTKSSPQTVCDEGFQARSVECYASIFPDNYPNFANIERDKQKCDTNKMPIGSRKCRTPCPGHCLLSDWSIWSECLRPSIWTHNRNNSCSGRRKRFRTILREHDINFITNVTNNLSWQCPGQSRLEQSESCDAPNNMIHTRDCWIYNVQWTSWTSCVLPPLANCGKGYRQRAANCVGRDGRAVLPSKCKRRLIQVPPPQLTSCDVLCPVDCVVGEWSRWSKCNFECGRSRMRFRTREILVRSIGNGRSCEDVTTVQSLPCKAVFCYSWKFGPWGNCQISNDVCGHGIQTRKLKCFQENFTDGVEVDNYFCNKKASILPTTTGVQGNLNANENTKSCYLPCPGECTMSKWSLWSKCQDDCKIVDKIKYKSRNSTGTQSRSRVAVITGKMFNYVCPKQEIQSRKCRSSVCYSYKWKMGPFINKIRKVWCERRPDGKVVSTGCFLNDKPNEHQPECDVSCRNITNLICQNGKCICRENKKPLECFQSFTNMDYSISSNERGKASSEATLSYEVNENVWMLPSPITQNGELKVWAYGVLAGLLVLIVLVFAVIYLTVSTCRRTKIRKTNRPITSTRPYTYPRFSSTAHSQLRFNTNSSRGGDSTLNSIRKIKTHRRKKNEVLSSNQSFNGSSLFGDPSNGIPPYYNARTSSIGRNLYPPFPLSGSPSARSNLSLNEDFND